MMILQEIYFSTFIFCRESRKKCPKNSGKVYSVLRGLQEEML